MSEKRKCVFAGTFDPPTVGHKKIIDACLELFDEVVVAVMINSQKEPALSAVDREGLLRKLYDAEPRIKILTYTGAVCDLLKEEGTYFYVRGVRDGLDFAYETRDLYATKKLYPEVRGIFIPAGQDDVQISSTLVRNSVMFDKEYLDYIPEKIRGDVKSLMEGKAAR
ncbi:MAG: pantetheine-phosphate adenylyltransferase [Clostridia bacterium]|nr:pantetheine-phosphate adenylyltransferase [Clostridia bacterium]